MANKINAAELDLKEQMLRVSPKSYSTEAAIFITDVYRNWLKALARAASSSKSGLYTVQRQYLY